MLTVQELRAQLNDLPDHLPVYLQSDPEGNGFHAACGSDLGIKEGRDDSRPDDISSPTDVDYALRIHPDCVVIYP